MTQFYGSDPEQLRALSKQMAKSAERIGSSIRTLTSMLDTPGAWLGPDMRGFRQSWQGDLLPLSKSAVQTLLQASKALQANADQQEKASQGGASGAGGGAPGGDTAGKDDGGTSGTSDRDGEARGSAESRTGREKDGTDSGGQTPGDEAYPGGLGDPVPGEDVPKPEAPPWHSDADSEEHGTEDANLGDHAKKHLVEGAANAAALKIPHASENLLHFLGNSGEPLETDVDQMLADVPELSAQADADVENLAKSAVEDARNSGVTGPVTYPVSTDWAGYYIDKDQSEDWFFATGGIQYSTQGQVTVYPPSTPDGEWTYKTETSLSYRDRYNWDGGKSTNVGPINVSDEELGRLNKVGIAHNYDLVGESSTRHDSGSVK